MSQRYFFSEKEYAQLVKNSAELEKEIKNNHIQRFLQMLDAVFIPKFIRSLNNDVVSFGLKLETIVKNRDGRLSLLGKIQEDDWLFTLSDCNNTPVLTFYPSDRLCPNESTYFYTQVFNAENTQTIKKPAAESKYSSTPSPPAPQQKKSCFSFFFPCLSHHKEKAKDRNENSTQIARNEETLVQSPSISLNQWRIF